MDAIFKDLNVKFTLPEDTKYYNKTEIFKLLKLSKQQQNNCLMALSKNNDKFVTLINYLGDINTHNDYDNLLNDYIKNNDKLGIKLIYKDKLTSNDHRFLDIQFFTGLEFNTVCIFSVINKKVFLAISNSRDTKHQELLKFPLEIMKSLTSCDN